MKLRTLLFTVLVVTVLFAANAPAKEPEINFGVISTESSKNLRSIWEPFLADMSAQTGIKINAFFVTDYAAVIEGMKFNKVQLAWYGNKAAMEAVDRAGGEVFAQTVNADGSAGYYSLLVAHKDAPFNDLAELFAQSQSLTFANGDPNSTSGFLVPSYYVFAVNNVDPKTAFKRNITGNHESNLLVVANKQVDVATANNEAIERLTLTNPQKAGEIKEIWRSPLIPSDPLVWRMDLDDETKKILSDFLFSYGKNPRELEILKALQWKGFKASDNDQLIPIRQLELFKQKAQIENDAKMDAGSKTSALAEIDAQLEALGNK